MGIITQGRYASVASTAALVVALAGTSYAAVQVSGADIKNNSVSTKDVKDRTLTLKDISPGARSGLKGTTGPARPVGRQVRAVPPGPRVMQGRKGDACLSSDPACRGPQGIPGTNGTNGAPGEPGPSAQYLNVNLANSSSQDVTVGTFALRFTCSGAANNRLFNVAVTGSGGAQLAGVKGIDDHPSNALPFTAGVALPPSGFASLVSIGVNSPNAGATFPHYYRLGGTLVLHNGLRSVTVVYDMFLDDRVNTGACAFRGSAVFSGLL